MKSIWKYVSIGLIVLLIGIFSISMYTQNKLKDRIIELQETIPDTTFVEVHDTVTFDSIVMKWRTKYDTTETYVVDTFYSHDTTIIIKEKIMQPDTFSVSSRWSDSTIDANIYIQGTGIQEKTTIDSVALDYKYIKQELVPKKHCCWLRRIFCGCD